MFTNTIAKRVAAVIKERVKTAQKHYDQVCSQIDTDCSARVDEAYRKRDSDKADIADTLVKGIVG